MENIAKVINNSHWQRDARCHFLSTKSIGKDTLIEIHSYATSGIYETLSQKRLFGVCVIFDHEFYIDTSMANLFYYTKQSYTKKFNREFKGANLVSFDDCYYFWLFKKDFCGISLEDFWVVDDFNDWYSLELNPECFCDYKRMFIEIIDESDNNDY